MAQTPLVRVVNNLERERYISQILIPVVVPYLQRLQDVRFEQDNTRPHVALCVLTYLDSEGVRLLLWPARSPDLTH